MMLSYLVILALSSCSQAISVPGVSPGQEMSDQGSWETEVSAGHRGELLIEAGRASRLASIERAHADVSGNWSFSLIDLESKPAGTVELCLSRSESALSGNGTIRSGTASEMATADGSLREGSTVLRVAALESTRLYHISISEMGGDRASGTFSIFGPDGLFELKGTVFGVKS